MVRGPTCFSKTSNWTSCGEKFLLKSSPHSPTATTSWLANNSLSSLSVSVSQLLASCGCTPDKDIHIHWITQLYVNDLRADDEQEWSFYANTVQYHQSSLVSSKQVQVPKLQVSKSFLQTLDPKLLKHTGVTLVLCVNSY